MKKLWTASLAAFLLMPACAGGELESSDDSGGREVTARGDAGSGARDTGAGTVRDLGTETVVDVMADATADAAVQDTAQDAAGGGDADSGAALVGPWGEIPAETPAPVADTMRASRAAMLHFCECCNSRYASDPQLCLSEFDDGGFEPDQCTLDALERAGADAEGYLGCLVGAYAELSTCVSECGVSCSLCENNHAFSSNRCASDYPSIATQLEACP